MARTKVKLLYSGFDQLRKSPEMQGYLDELIQGVAQRAGDGYAADVMVGRKKVIANAYTDSFKARRECAKTSGNTLMEALQS